MTSRIRAPFEEEALECAELLFTSGPALYRYAFAMDEPHIYDFFKIFFHRPGTILSKERILVVYDGTRVRGLVLSFPSNGMAASSRRMLKYTFRMIRVSGFSGFCRILIRLGLNKHFPALEKDELFISNLAVEEGSRGQGLGRKLLQAAEHQAIQEGLKKLSLFVEIDNAAALRLYRKNGFATIEKAILPEKYKKQNLHGFYKMIKEIPVGNEGDGNA